MSSLYLCPNCGGDLDLTATRGARPARWNFATHHEAKRTLLGDVTWLTCDK